MQVGDILYCKEDYFYGDTTFMIGDRCEVMTTGNTNDLSIKYWKNAEVRNTINDKSSIFGTRLYYDNKPLIYDIFETKNERSRRIIKEHCNE